MEIEKIISKFSEDIIDEIKHCKNEECITKNIASYLGCFDQSIKNKILQPDIICDDIALEVKFLKDQKRTRFYLGIGQALSYRIILKLKPILIQVYDFLIEDINKNLKLLAEKLQLPTIAIDLSNKKCYIYGIKE